MATRKQIAAIPVSGHSTIKKVYVLQILEVNPEIMLLSQEISEGSFELMNERGHLNQIYPVDYSKIPQGVLPPVEFYEII
jgi:hypothetical protein